MNRSTNGFCQGLCGAVGTSCDAAARKELVCAVATDAVVVAMQEPLLLAEPNIL